MPPRKGYERFPSIDETVLRTLAIGGIPTFHGKERKSCRITFQGRSGCDNAKGNGFPNKTRLKLHYHQQHLIPDEILNGNMDEADFRAFLIEKGYYNQISSSNASGVPSEVSPVIRMEAMQTTPQPPQALPPTPSQQAESLALPQRPEVPRETSAPTASPPQFPETNRGL